ncbi:uncharacterized protein LOC106636034 isoform X2 [Copidosoma floridanum]|uniref:uncharacterized protein LOC106636034 isoform X2 n=1 Tax=Copidosoma floridanum TaxID=29053 RepID=UPI0006C9B579|nr:uncharacterized protein LOC106636034 isoform X2 [Copidosoma floridanum]
MEVEVEENEKIQMSDVHDVVRIVEVSSITEAHVPVRLTPTGKISHAKSRVYTQRYRKEWEDMSDFKDWLTSVPDQLTRAYCKFCDRNLHAHRLSLLKHMCTLKHQRAAVQFNKREGRMSSVETIKREYATYDDSNDYEDGEMYDETQEEEAEVSGGEMEESGITSESEREKEASTSQAVINADSEIEADTHEVQLQMVVDSENDGHDEDDGDYENNEQFYEVEQQKDNEVIQEVVNSNERTKGNPDSKKMYILVKGSLISPKLSPVVSKAQASKKICEINTVPTTSTPRKTSVTETNDSEEALNKNTNLKKVITKTLKSSTLSTHVLDTCKGVPVNGLQVILYRLKDGRWIFVHESTTAADGMCNDFSKILSPGRYKFHYDVEKYYNTRKIGTIFPFIEIVFDIKDPQKKYHIPLMLTPYSYSTYRDILR